MFGFMLVFKMILFLNFLICLNLVSSYNLDSKNVVVYTHPSNEKRLNYFGYSVAIRPRAGKFVNESWVVQIGAPRSNGSNLLSYEPGGVYRCFANGRCQIHILDNYGNQFVKQAHVVGKGRMVMKTLAAARKDEGWVGVSMTLKETRSGEISVVCGHRIAYQALHQPLHIVDDFYLTVGGCYLENLGNTSPAILLMPLKDEDRAYRDPLTSKPYFDWGVGLAGMSAWFTSNGIGLLLGAPHVYYMTGTMLAYFNGFTNPLVADVSANIDETVRLDYFSYYGYSVASGFFFDDRKEWYVFGAPRSFGLHGRVFPAQFGERRVKDTKVTVLNIYPSIQRGETYGEYFGASLGVGDINGDGKDDLVVGAPMFSRRFPDQGRIYVFLGSKLGFVTPLQAGILDGVAAYGRFGTCVSVVGDLDQDGYKDVLIGSPNEKSSGAIYLYRGGPRGLSTSPAQVIYAGSIDSGLRGFGISISQAMDLDNNLYPDVLVGAYQSDQAVLLRTRPVIHFSSYISHPRFIDRKQSSFNITVCLSFISKHPPPICYVDASLIVDGVLNRCKFEKSSNMFAMEEVKINSTSPSCQNLTIYFHVNRLNGTFNHPVHVELENTLHESNEIGKPEKVWLDVIAFKEASPIANFEMSNQKISVDVPFAGDCGLDNICHSHLTLKCQLVNAPAEVFIIGSTNPLLLKVLVQNSNEPAHYTFLHLSLDGALASDMKLSDPNCEIHDLTNSIICKLETLLEGTKKIMSFEFITDLWATTASPNINLTVFTTTSSNDTGSEKDKCSFSLSLISDAYAQLVAHPSVSTIVLSKDAPKLVNFSHHYEVEKSGVSPIKGVLFSISIPTYYDQSMAFTSFDREIPHITVENEIEEYVILGRKKKNDSVLLTRTFLEEPDDASIQSIPTERTLFLNCSTERVTCKTFRYVLASVQMSLDFSIVLNMSTLDPILNIYDVIYFSTNGSAEIKHIFRENDISRDTVSTSITKFMYVSTVDTRVIAMSVVAGVFLLGLIIPLLIKNGFFRRKTKEQMEAMKVQDMISQRFSVYDDTD